MGEEFCALSIAKSQRCDGREATDRMHINPPARQTFIQVTVVGWDKWKKRVARRQRYYAIRIIKSRLTRRKRREKNRTLMQVYALHYALHYATREMSRQH